MLRAPAYLSIWLGFRVLRRRFGRREDDGAVLRTIMGLRRVRLGRLVRYEEARQVSRTYHRPNGLWLSMLVLDRASPPASCLHGTTSGTMDVLRARKRLTARLPTGGPSLTAQRGFVASVASHHVLLHGPCAEGLI